MEKLIAILKSKLKDLKSDRNVVYNNGLLDAIQELEKFEKDATFQDVANILIKHLNDTERYHPHHTIIVTSTTAELVEGVSGFTNETYLKD